MLTTPPLLPSQQCRINLSDLKSQIAKKLGPQRSQQYFIYLNQFLARKLSKAEFNKYCLLIIGHENVHLHNQLIGSILRNAFQAKTLPPISHARSGLEVPAGVTGKKSTPADNENNHLTTSMSMHSIWSNGDILPPSPRKVRSGPRDRRIKDRPSPLGQNSQKEVTFCQSLPAMDENNVRVNGALSPCDSKRPMRDHQLVPLLQPAKRSRRQSSMAHEQASLQDKGVEEVAIVENEQEMDHTDNLKTKRGPLQAPLGIPFCRTSVGGARRLFFQANFVSDIFINNFDSGGLCSTEALNIRMENAAEAQGLAGVAMDCSNLLNLGLDAYLKQLIESCLHLARARSVQEPLKHSVHKHQGQTKQINGVWPGNHMHVQSNAESLGYPLEMKKQCSISLQDFRAAMELDPQKLGEDWSLLLEKICLRSCEERC